MKRFILALSLTGLSSLCFAEVSYDAITGQSFSFYAQTLNPFADDTKLANLTPVKSIDWEMLNVDGEEVTTYATLGIYTGTPATGPQTLLEGMTETISIPNDHAFHDVNFAFRTPWIPPTTTLWTSMTVGNESLGLLIPSAVPVIGTSTDEIACLLNGSWTQTRFSGDFPTSNLAIRYNATPEPCSMLVLSIGALGLIVRRRRK